MRSSSSRRQRSGHSFTQMSQLLHHCRVISSRTATPASVAAGGTGASSGPSPRRARSIHARPRRNAATFTVSVFAGTNSASPDSHAS